MPIEEMAAPYASRPDVDQALRELVRVAGDVANAFDAWTTNLYGPGDNYHPENSHVIPALIRKFHEAKLTNEKEVVVWGTGTPRREFMYSEDMADACVFLMDLANADYEKLLGGDESLTGRFEPPLVNIGVGSDLTIKELAEAVKSVVGYLGSIVFDASKPDGTPRKLMDVKRLHTAGWQATTEFRDGLSIAYQDFRKAQESNSSM